MGSVVGVVIILYCQLFPIVCSSMIAHHLSSDSISCVVHYCSVFVPDYARKPVPTCSAPTCSTLSLPTSVAKGLVSVARCQVGYSACFILCISIEVILIALCFVHLGPLKQSPLLVTSRSIRDKPPN